MLLPDGNNWSETVRRSEIEKENKIRELNQSAGEVRISFPALYKFFKRLFSRKPPGVK